MNLTYLLTLFAAFLTANAWHFTAMTKKNFCGKRRTFGSGVGKNDCFNIPSDVAGNIHSAVFCTMPHARCSITLHSKGACQGELLGSPSGTWPHIWEDTNVKGKKVKAKSFKIQGCSDVLSEVDVTNCYDTHEPWTTKHC